MSNIIVKHNPDELAYAIARIFCRSAQIAVDQKNYFTVALSGGSTPRPMHRLLAREPFRFQIPWNQTHIFWVDERMVSPDHTDSNFGLACKDLLNQVPLPPGNIHPMPVEAIPDQCALQYQRTLKDFFKPHSSAYPVFDLIILGLGSDGHVASLFPGTSVFEGDNAWVIPVKGGNPDLDRLTLTYPVLNSAAYVLFMVSGKKKAAIIKTLFGQPAAGLPAQNIRPISRNLTWLLDRAAASLLPERTHRENRCQ